MQRLLGAEALSSSQLLARCSYVWINTNVYVDYPRAVPEKFKFIGGIAISSPRDIDEVSKQSVTS